MASFRQKHTTTKTHDSVDTLIDKNTNRLKSVYRDIGVGIGTKKGNEFKKMIEDFINNPEDYFLSNIEKVSESLEEIKNYLQILKVSIEARNNLLHFLK